MIPGYVDFEFDLPSALLAQLIEVLDEIESAVLIPENLVGIPESQGVYQLFHNGELVYIGKTDAEAGLRQRLDRHSKKILHRHGIALQDVSFRSARVFVFTAVDLEFQLIRHYRNTSGISWNGSGFGSNDPGRRRDAMTYKDVHFDARYPIDAYLPLNWTLPVNSTALEVFEGLKEAVPYVFRYEGQHPDLEGTVVSLGGISHISTAAIIEHVVAQLPPGWQATLLPGYIILYKEYRDYPYGRVIARS